MSTLDKAFIQAFTKRPQDSPSDHASAAPHIAATTAGHATADHIESGGLETVAVTFADGVWRRVDRPAPSNAISSPHIPIRKAGRQPPTSNVQDAAVRRDAYETTTGLHTCPVLEEEAISPATFALTAAMESAVRGWQTETQVVALRTEENTPSRPTAEQEDQADAAAKRALANRWSAPYFGVVEMLADQTQSLSVAVYEDWELPAPVVEQEAPQTPQEPPLPDPCFQWTDAGYHDTGFSLEMLTNMVIAPEESAAPIAASVASEAFVTPPAEDIAQEEAVAEKIVEGYVGDVAVEDVAVEDVAVEDVAVEDVAVEDVQEDPKEDTVEASPPALVETAPPEETPVVAEPAAPVAEQQVVEHPIAAEQIVEQQVTEESVVAEQPKAEEIAPEQSAALVETAPPSPKVFAPSWEVDQFKWPAIVDKLIGEEHEQLEQVAVRLLEEARDGKNLLAVTGGMRGEGRTTLTLSLARLASQLGHTVAIVDADFAHHEIGPQLGLDIPQGWECVVSEKLRLEEVAVVSLSDRLTAFPLGSSAANTSLDGERVSVVLQQLAEAFDLVLVDLGPVEASAQQGNESDKAGLAARAILVQDARRPNEAQLQDIVRRLDALGIEALGVVETFRPAA